MVDRERISCLDYVKGILIIFVVLGHVMPEDNTVHSWIYSWHMPAFFILNGMLLSYTSYVRKPLLCVEGVIFQGIKKLIIPYYSYGCLLMVVRWWNSGFDVANLKWQIVDLGYFWGIGATWFLPCLFFAQLIYWGLKRLSFQITFRNYMINRLFMSLITIAIMIIPFKIKADNVIVMVIFRSIIGVAFIELGELLFPVIEKINEIKKSFLLVTSVSVFILSCVTFLLTGKVPVSLNILRLSPFIVYISNALLGTIWVFLVAIVCERNFSITCKVLDFYGKSSLVIMGTHQVLMILLAIPIKMNYGLNIVFCIIILVVEIPIILIVNRVEFCRKGK